MGKNGYFKLASKEHGLYITVYPPKEGGTPVVIDELLSYGAKLSIMDYFDITKAKPAFVKSDKPIRLKLAEAAPLPSNEFGDYAISSDNMKVEAVFYPGFVDAGELTLDEILSDLAAHNVRKGIDEKEIQRFLDEREYYVPYVVAKGQPPIEGHDGSIEYKFNTDVNVKPKMNDDGTVDYHRLDNVNHVSAGDVLAVLHPDDRGTPGYDVRGNVVSPHKVKRVLFKYGRNMHVSDDGKQLISDVNGHVTLENDKIFVSNVLELVDVDTSTGDIDYNGNVLVKGNVITGFSVRATGDITVEGLVEGADISAGGNIILLRGVQGGSRAVLSAGGNIVSKFIESASMVSASGSIETDSILHSKVVAKGPIKVSGRNGLIVGGDVKSSVLIECKTIGNSMGTATIVGVGVDPTVKKRIDVLKNEMEELGKKNMTLSQIVSALRKRQEAEGSLPPDRIEMQQKTMREMILIEQKLTTDKNELEECRCMINEDYNAKIVINKSAYVGTKIMFGDQYIFLRDNYDYCKFMKQGADIKPMSI